MSLYSSHAVDLSSFYFTFSEWARGKRLIKSKWQKENVNLKKKILCAFTMIIRHINKNLFFLYFEIIKRTYADDMYAFVFLNSMKMRYVY